MPKYRRLHYQEVTSTNDVCFKKSKESEIPIVVTADKQTKGRGRNQKDWKSHRHPRRLGCDAQTRCHPRAPDGSDP